MSDDKSQLIEMGFAEPIVVKALKLTGNAGLQPAIDWIVAHPDDDGTMESTPEDEGEVTEENPQSFKCDDCEKLLKDTSMFVFSDWHSDRLILAAAEMHAVKTQHVNFSESTIAIKPLTAEEKAVKVQELKDRIARRKEEKRLAEIEEAKQRETVRRTTGAEMQLIREKIELEQMAKEVEERKRQKEADRIAKENVRKQLEADKLERKREAEEKKMMAAGKAISPPVSVNPSTTTSNASKDYSEARIQIRIPSGPPLTKIFSASDPLSAIYDFCKQSGVVGDFKLMQTFPRKVLSGDDLKRTLKDLGLIPSAALVVQ